MRIFSKKAERLSMVRLGTDGVLLLLHGGLLLGGSYQSHIKAVYRRGRMAPKLFSPRSIPWQVALMELPKITRPRGMVVLSW